VSWRSSWRGEGFKPCRVMPARWFADVDHPQCKALTLYIPRTKFVDFLLYVPRGTEEVYVIPRGLLEYNTTWSEPKLTTTDTRGTCFRRLLQNCSAGDLRTSVPGCVV
jgi:hypothetical protein